MSARVADTSADTLAEAMVGERAAAREPVAYQRAPNGIGTPVLQIQQLSLRGDRGEPAVRALSLTVRAGEIVGVAGVSGNGQRELMQSLTGQRVRDGGSVLVDGQPYAATRAQNHHHAVRSLPEEPLANACVGDLGVGCNMALRGFDRAPLSRAGWMLWRRVGQRARELITEYGVKTQGDGAAMRTLSGGNVQRAVLARELSGSARLLLVANPVFGLDFAAVAEIHARLMAARNAGAAVLLISEDLDELLELSDRIVVISEGRIVHETPAVDADRRTLGAHMGGRAHATHETVPTTPEVPRAAEREAA
jgi:simple sugar transport system ATP-binding protein